MNPGLRPLLLGLVLLNLAFVQLTGAVDPMWLLWLWTGVAASPLLHRWHDRVGYRLLWNATVMLAFTLLLRHAVSTGLLHMLEDGLLLAALCQVHLLNNVGARQRPDLLFFNSFLIAFVTSFFSHDVGWSLCFVAYIALLVPALQVYVVLPAGAAADRALLRAVLRDSAPRSVSAVVLTALAFVLWPRDFRHEGWLSDTIRLAGQQFVSFTDEIRLDRRQTPALSERPVLHIRPGDGQRQAVPSHWRGVTFVRFDGRGWQHYQVQDFGTRRATDPPWSAVSSNECRRQATLREPPLEVTLLDPGSGRLFLPLLAAAVTLPPGVDAVLLDPKADGVLALDESLTASPLRCVVRLGRTPATARPAVDALSLALLQQLPADLPHSFRSLAEGLRRELADDASREQLAEHVARYLSVQRRYALPGTPGAANNFAEFMLGAAGGHCEYFATALALLLRVQGVPCRLVGGYLAHEWDEARSEMVVRERDAHAWVEVLSNDGEWATYDATPAGGLERGDRESLWGAVLHLLEDSWRVVTGFDAQGRQRLFQSIGELFAALLARPWLPAAVAVLLCLWWRRRRRRLPASVRELRAAGRAAGLRPRPGETPREGLERARLLRQPRPAPPRLVAAVEAHERDRYARPLAADDG